MNDYFAYRWHFVKASKPLFRILLRGNEIYRAGDAVFILTKPRQIFGELQTNLAIMTGSLTGSLLESKRMANSLGAQHLGSYIPYNRYFLRRARELGFSRERWGKHCLVFEKAI